MTDVAMRALFAQDPDRFSRFSLGMGGILFDYAKDRITTETMDLLLDLARQCQLDQAIEAMFSGQKINVTENRAVLHVRCATAATRRSRWTVTT